MEGPQPLIPRPGDELHFQTISRTGETVDAGVLVMPGKGSQSWLARLPAPQFARADYSSVKSTVMVVITSTGCPFKRVGS